MKAPIKERIISFFFDCCVALILMTMIIYAGFLAWNNYDSAIGRLLGLALLLLGLVAGIAFALLRDGLFGGLGVGKKIMRIRVARSDGSRCDLISSAMRNITLLIPILNILELILAVADREGKRIGDKIARTHVVE
jgi:uncharacterized RDD family membrane protein YckC